MFRGQHRYSLDAKGRIVLPPKFRRALGDAVVATRGLDECVAIYSQSEWAKNEEKLQGLPVDRRDFVRFMLATAEDVEIDGQGRITIPAHLRQYAKIGREAVVVGVGTRIEIWSAENWEKYTGKVEAVVAEIASQMKDFSI